MTQTFKDHFSHRSGDYAQYRPTYPRELIDYLVGLPERRERALDCGCGSGQLSEMLAERFAHVVATDASAQQLASARVHPRVTYRQVPAERSGLEDDSVDLVTAAQAAHWFDLDRFYAEVRRVVRPGGAIALITYGRVELVGEAGRCLADFYDEVATPNWPPERHHVETGYRRLPFPFREIEAPPLSMSASWPFDTLIGYINTWSAVRNAEKALGRGPFEHFAAALAASWGDPLHPKDVQWPLALRVGYV